MHMHELVMQQISIGMGQPAGAARKKGNQHNANIAHVQKACHARG
jgi:hypothetical protein